ncbi:SLAC1 anion channel family protein [Ferruginibacter paludis]|uniref:SLAC1 anion channel family protein n=1 Tax=Ferruginibacter paludis TaxID=1310417 RepID=UPI0025B5A402|nr:SLAC1 anion channel family protein [Ferruginibacter paludis]MDN3654203.1 SLAC1 anion channel family protein [Ferruginibacter paludis]
MGSAKLNTSFISFLPVSLFGGILGMTGLTFSWRLAEAKWGFPHWMSKAIGLLAIVLFLALFTAYLVKWIKYPSTVINEFNNPVSSPFFTTFIVSLLLLPGIVLPFSERIATVVWSAGVALIILFTLLVLGKWMRIQQNTSDAQPSWLLPVVGMLDVPIVGSQLHFAGAREICLYCFAVGVFLAIIILPIVFARLFFGPPLPEALQPTLLVLLLPFAITYSDYEDLTGGRDITGSILYYAGLFLLVLLASKIALLPKCCPFRVSWWSVSFPLAAITIASFRYTSHPTPIPVQWIPAVLLPLLTLTLLYLLTITFYRIITNQLFLNNSTAENATKGLQTSVR